MDAPTLRLMAALDSAHPWAAGLQPCRRLRRLRSAKGPGAVAARQQYGQRREGEAEDVREEEEEADEEGSREEEEEEEGRQGEEDKREGEPVRGGKRRRVGEAGEEDAGDKVVWEVCAQPEPLSHEMLLALALLMQEAARAY